MLLFSVLVFGFVFVNSREIPDVVTDIDVDLDGIGHGLTLLRRRG